MELHVWGNHLEFAIIDPESIATIWYLTETVPTSEFTVIPSSNNNLAKTGRLPTLVISQNQSIDGYISIVRYLSLKGYKSLDEKLNQEERAINQSLITFIKNEVSKIVDYSLYLNKKNYENYTRAIFGKYLAFPLQYNTPILFKSKAKARCELIGLTIDDNVDIESDMLNQIPTISSKIQKLKREQMIEYKLLIKNSKNNMKCLNYLQLNFIEFLNKLIRELGHKGEIYPIFNQEMTSGELLLLSYLNTLLSPQLPDQFISNYLKVSIKEENYNTIISKIEELNSNLLKVIKRQPKLWKESANIFNSF
ncbi:hypothetical protein WICMUC_002723 [Wickerhamomyces mucosus]|uniref:Mitochondrial outer membrane transport complex Sam37/metaxin N-terminal domain-containing protein n=1 Tax=Wickerhamomyces mucosus TaxID=1378264 RepID=A0A9P8PQE0_9ASCO|nr:hypothetical protein WICMUC_002723 [Wickerhamomyces mucosus]